MESEKAKNLAERIAYILQESESSNAPNDLSFLRASIEKINERLTNIELKLNNTNDFIHPPSFILHPSKSHVSQEKFGNLEELADQIISSISNEKACPFEPAGKPCDHCAMCNSRGF